MIADTAGRGGAAESRLTGYSFYTLGVLAVVNFLNYADRSIFAILAEAIKADLKLDDAQLGFLFGTAFAVLFALIGIPAGRVADRVSRTKLLAIGLLIWTTMTATAALATSFLMLALTRTFVGFGEACSNPCSHSLASDYFPGRWRATALAVLLVGTYLGTSGALIIGGYILDNWADHCAVVGGCGLRPWQAAFLIMGAAGLVVVVAVTSLREPPRTVPDTKSLPEFIAEELTASLPPLTLLAAARLGRAAVVRNLLLAAVIALLAGALAAITDDWLQWLAVGIGSYSIGSWIQTISRRDPAFFSLSFGCPIFVLGLIGMAVNGILAGTVAFWVSPYAIRTLGFSAGEAGIWIGPLMMAGSVSGVMIGAIITDRWKQRDIRAPFFISMISLAGSVPVTLLMFTTADHGLFIATIAIGKFFLTIWAGAAAAFVQDMVLPRMRGTASATYALLITLITLAFGPYTAGKVSELTGSLGVGVMSLLLLVPLGFAALWAGARHLGKEDIASRHARAVALEAGPFHGRNS